jgi:hydroxymethylbilane synthase
MTSKVRVATRGSALALAQTRQLVEMLRQNNPDCIFEINTVATTGDRITDRPLSQFRGIGVFVKELEKALLANEADMAVHSLKDVPVQSAKGLTLAAFQSRGAAEDVLLTKTGMTLEKLPKGSVIGTSSPRRLVQLKAHRPDLAFKDLRGNLDTRLRKLKEGLYDGIIAAVAGLLRLEKEFDRAGVLPFSVCLPAAGQGCLAIECRTSDKRALRVAATVDDENTRNNVSAERDFLREMGGGCQMPIAVYAETLGDTLTITGMVGEPDSGRLVRATMTVAGNEHKGAGRMLAEKMSALCKENRITVC